jgi:hypothetical protein
MYEATSVNGKLIFKDQTSIERNGVSQTRTQDHAKGALR